MHEVHSRLKAIMFVQVTEMTGNNREAPVSSERLSENQLDIGDHLHHFRGELLEVREGEIYACFPGTVTAFNAALLLQSMMPKFILRIGLHLGEVIQRNGKVQGRDVNFASRLPHFARAGGICLSQSVFQYLQEKDKQILVPLGPHCLKNIDGRISLYAYLPAGQSCRSRLSEFRRLISDELYKYRYYGYLLLLAAAVATFAFPVYSDKPPIAGKLVKLYVAGFQLQTGNSDQQEFPESIEVAVRSLISGRHGQYELHLLNRRADAEVELLVTIKKHSGRIQAGYVINGLPDGKTLAYGGFEEDESRMFYIQERLSDQILSTLGQYLIQDPSLASGSRKARLELIGAER